MLKLSKKSKALSLYQIMNADDDTTKILLIIIRIICNIFDWQHALNIVNQAVLLANSYQSGRNLFYWFNYTYTFALSYR